MSALDATMEKMKKCIVDTIMKISFWWCYNKIFSAWVCKWKNEHIMWVATKEVRVWKWKNKHETQQRSNKNLYEKMNMKEWLQDVMVNELQCQNKTNLTTNSKI